MQACRTTHTFPCFRSHAACLNHKLWSSSYSALFQGAAFTDSACCWPAGKGAGGLRASASQPASLGGSQPPGLAHGSRTTSSGGPSRGAARASICAQHKSRSVEMRMAQQVWGGGGHGMRKAEWRTRTQGSGRCRGRRAASSTRCNNTAVARKQHDIRSWCKQM
eukprot:361250-Chlamydomonas_euryale.AAC.21